MKRKEMLLLSFLICPIFLPLPPNMMLLQLSRFEQLKEDFRYNLTLLEARDQEIDRLEKLVDTGNRDLVTSENERRSLTGRLEIFEMKDIERQDRHNHDKQSSKVNTHKSIICVLAFIFYFFLPSLFSSLVIFVCRIFSVFCRN